MEDRLSIHPGEVAFVKKDTGETIYGTLEMHDDPIVEGTPPTKANLFDDETQSRYPPGTETVNLALRETVLLSDKATDAEAAAGTDDSKWMTPKKVRDHLDEVGDIRITERTSLGDKYLLANGAKVDKNTYPQLQPYLTHKYPYSSFSNKTIVSSDIAGNTIYSHPEFVYLNGYYIYISNTGSGSSITAYYTSNPLGSWNSKVLIGSPNGTFADISYGNGKWVIVTSSGYSARYYTATSLTGSWSGPSTLPFNYNNETNPKRLRIKFLNGYFVVYGELPGIAYSSDGVSWSISSFAYSIINDMLYADGYYWAAVSSAGIYRTSSLNYAFSKFEFQSTTLKANKLAYVDGKILFVYSDKSAGYIDGTTGSVHYIPNLPEAPAYLPGYDWAILKKDGYWLYADYVDGSGIKLYYTSNLDSSWSQKTLVNSSNIDVNYTYSFYVFEYGDYFILMYINSNRFPALTYSESGYFLPTVSVTGAKAFIRAKE